jgi:hypothetical protein
MPILQGLAGALGATDPAHADCYTTGLRTPLASLQPLSDKIAAIRGQCAVAASEPVLARWQTNCACGLII